MTETFKGILAMIGACTIWGLSPLFFKTLEHVPPIEVFAHRTLWAFVFFVAILLFQGRYSQLPHLLLASPWRVLFATVMISINWLVFIWSVQVGRVMETSLGYYIFPLVSVLLGAAVFGERLRRVQWIAVALAALAVTVLTFGLGVVPGVSLLLGVTFGLYGMLKKGLDAGPMVSVTAEVAMVFPFVLAGLAWRYAGPDGYPHSAATGALLFLSGVAFTAIPLMLFSLAARRVRLATIGLVQYMNPTLHFACATLVFGEVFTLWHAIAFGLIWTALALYSGQALATDRAARRRDTSSGTSDTV